jgi:hypothetical protein
MQSPGEIQLGLGIVRRPAQAGAPPKTAKTLG